MAALAKRLRKAILAIPGIIESPGIYTDEDAFWMNGKQIACWQGDNGMQLRLTQEVIRANRDRFKADPRIGFRGKSSPGINVTFASSADIPFVTDLARMAADAHRPAPGEPMKPPPTGADLERRRRFH